MSLHNLVGKVLLWHRRGHGLESRWSHLNVSDAYKKQLLKSGTDLGGGGGGAEAAAAPPFSSSEIFFLSKYTIILSFCKQSVGPFDFFS